MVLGRAMVFVGNFKVALFIFLHMKAMSGTRMLHIHLEQPYLAHMHGYKIKLRALRFNLKIFHAANVSTRTLFLFKTIISNYTNFKPVKINSFNWVF